MSQEVTNGPLGSYHVKITPSAEGDLQHMLIDNAFAPTRYDQIELGYTGSNLTSVIYKLLGATIGTLTLSYTGSNLTGVVRS